MISGQQKSSIVLDHKIQQYKKYITKTMDFMQIDLYKATRLQARQEKHVSGEKLPRKREGEKERKMLIIH
jgi:hypothetical protein